MPGTSSLLSRSSKLTLNLACNIKPKILYSLCLCCLYLYIRRETERGTGGEKKREKNLATYHHKLPCWFRDLKQKWKQQHKHQWWRFANSIEINMHFSCKRQVREANVQGSKSTLRLSFNYPTIYIYIYIFRVTQHYFSSCCTVICTGMQ